MGSMDGIGFFKREHLISLDNYEYRKGFFFFYKFWKFDFRYPLRPTRSQRILNFRRSLDFF